MENDTTSRKHFICAPLFKSLFLCALLATIYTLSMGPAYWALCHKRFSQESFNALYYPLKQLVNHSRFSRMYLDFWSDPVKDVDP
jgi:hypothetical protein